MSRTRKTFVIAALSAALAAGFAAPAMAGTMTLADDHAPVISASAGNGADVVFSPMDDHAPAPNPR
ncbi:hypothetical protein [Streptomyces cucumeris]|uniref:hypothetical protein n=1 Tax=Streptomyces cucumeris TaxID=2962890 RepID=UPI003D729E3A